MDREFFEGGSYISTINLLRSIFFFTAIISTMLGVLILYFDRKSALNRVFFALCLSLTIWALGFSLALDAPSAQACLFWRRLSAVGWGSQFAVLLNFSLIFSGKIRTTKHRWLTLLSYAPALFVVWVFALSNETTAHQYNFVRFDTGWLNIAVNNIWDMVFYGYYLVYGGCSLWIIWRHGRKSNSADVKKQSNTLVFTFALAVVAGSVTDIFADSIFRVKMPQIAPVIILLPVFAAFYSMLRYGLMNPKVRADADFILTHTARLSVYKNLTVTFVGGSLVSYVVQLLYYRDVILPIFSSILVLLMGAVTYLLKRLRLDDFFKDILLIVFISLFIPLISLIFADYGGITVWAVAFLFIIISMVFNKPAAYLSLSISAISTQLLLWMLKPQITLSLDMVDYVGRIGILCIALGLAYVVNKIFTQRLRRNAYQLSLQRFISAVSSDFISVTQENLEEKMSWVIRIIGKLFSADHINIVRIDSTTKTISYARAWGPPGKATVSPAIFSIQTAELDWLAASLVNHESIHCPSLDTLPPDADHVRQRLMSLGIYSFLAVPIQETDTTMTILEFSYADGTKKWDEDKIRTLNILAYIFNDAYVKAEAEREISFMAYHDYLTGLPNRRLFKDRLEQAIALAKRTEKLIGVIFLDLDSFKTINDTIGHERADALIKVVSDKLRTIVRQSDTVSRFGGDEFLIIANNLSSEHDITIIIRNIMAVLHEPFFMDGQEFALATSAGIAMYPFDGTDTETLIQNADSAMYKAKERGKNQYVICTSDLKEEVLNKIKIMNSLHKAIERNEFFLNYQPQIQLSTGKITGLEALIRWRHPSLGLIPPSVFIPIAEQTGVIHAIGDWVLAEACRQNKAWQDAGYSPVCMAVNVSAAQLRSRDYFNAFHDILVKTASNPKTVELEITESAAMNGTTDIIALMNRVRTLGVTIAIDDFGTDYSSLNRLTELPIDKLKIDKRFVDGIDATEKDRAIVRTIISLAKNLDLKVIAEGVEQESQLAFLQQEDCDEVQGYYFHKPMSTADIEVLLKKQTGA